MNILILNWRDTKHPLAGGAEILTHEIAKRWIRKGHIVVQLCSGFSNSKRDEIIDGVKIIRRGRWWNIHIFGIIYYFFKIKKQTDVIIDEAHWFPFFSIIYARKKTILFVCEVANKLFFKIFPYPIALLGRLFEKIYLYVYKNSPTLAISLSTKRDLIKEGFRESRIVVLPMGLTLPNNLIIYKKENKPTVIYLGRLVKQKGIEDAIVAFEIIKKRIPNAVLWVVGSGVKPYVEKIKKKIAILRLVNSVKFFGFVDEEQKFRLLSKAHILISSSTHEGWGLTIPEAGVVGTVSVVYNSAGFTDTVLNNKTGLICSENTPNELAKKVISLFMDNFLYLKLRTNVLHHSKQFDWNYTAKVALSTINNVRKNIKRQSLV